MTNLGLVCLTSPTVVKAERISYRTITRTALNKLTMPEKVVKLCEIYRDNAQMLTKAIAYCYSRGIKMYRMTTGMFPFADLPTFAPMIPVALLASAGKLAADLGVRLLSHPDQYCVLASAKPETIANSISILSLEAHIFDCIGLPQSHWAPINIHIGKSHSDPKTLAPDGSLHDPNATIISVIKDLPDNIRLRLTLENDDKGNQGAEKTLETCIEAGVPLLFDYHHHLCAEKLDSYDHPSMSFYQGQAAETWSNPDWAVYHISNGKAGLHDRAHADLITTRPTDLSQVNWLEVEAKAKNDALDAFPW